MFAKKNCQINEKLTSFLVTVRLCPSSIMLRFVLEYFQHYLPNILFCFWFKIAKNIESLRALKCYVVNIPNSAMNALLYKGDHFIVREKFARSIGRGKNFAQHPKFGMILKNVSCLFLFDIEKK